jgi:hypothetical protein
VAKDRDKWRTLVHAAANSRVPRKAVSYSTSSRSALVHKVSFQDHSTFVEKGNVFWYVHHGVLTFCTSQVTQNVGQKDVSSVTSNGNELPFHKQANSMTNRPRTFALGMHSRRLYAPESPKRIQKSLESVICTLPDKSNPYGCIQLFILYNTSENYLPLCSNRIFPYRFSNLWWFYIVTVVVLYCYWGFNIVTVVVLNCYCSFNIVTVVILYCYCGNFILLLW